MGKLTSLKLPPGSAAVIFDPDGEVHLVLPKHKDEEDLADDSPAMLAGLAGVLATDEWAGVRQELIQRLKEMN